MNQTSWILFTKSQHFATECVVSSGAGSVQRKTLNKKMEMEIMLLLKGRQTTNSMLTKQGDSDCG